MGYVAVRGGQEAIEASLDLLAWERARSGRAVSIKDITAAFPDLIDQVMSESSLYAPDLAALALKQAQGSPEEAVFLLRAFRSTLERPYISRTVESDSLHVERRISAAFKDIPGGQILGATRDYSHRLIDFDLQKESEETLRELRKKLKRAWKTEGEEKPREADRACPKVADYLREEGLLVQHPYDDTPPADITMEPLNFPAPRSARLQTLTRGMTQAVSALGYAAIRGFGPAHPTVAELRYGEVAVSIEDPFQPAGEGERSPEAEQGQEDQESEDESYYLGSIPVTEVESLFEVEHEGAHGDKELSFDLGYGMIMGRGETKAIAMSVLDNCLSQGDKNFPTQDEEFVLYHVDGVEATGFISHLKLPHYVTFQSKLSSVRKTKDSSHESDL